MKRFAIVLIAGIIFAVTGSISTTFGNPDTQAVQTEDETQVADDSQSSFEDMIMDDDSAEVEKGENNEGLSHDEESEKTFIMDDEEYEEYDEKPDEVIVEGDEV